MVDQNNAGPDDDDLLKGLDGGLDKEQASADSSRPLPKKVELDIDDFLEEEIEEEPPPPPPTEEKPAPPPEELPGDEEEPSEKPKRFALPKLILLVSIVLIPLLAITATALYLLRDDEPPPEEPKTIINTIDLNPFLINFPPPNNLFILKLDLSIKFPNPLILQDFQNNRLIQRDRIYRLVQGLGPTIRAAWEAEKQKQALEIDLANARGGNPVTRKEIQKKLEYAKDQAKRTQSIMQETLQKEIANIINNTLRTGRIDQLDINRMDPV
jgi:flagellar basal body-associated protein FliL